MQRQTQNPFAVLPEAMIVPALYTTAREAEYAAHKEWPEAKSQFLGGLQRVIRNLTGHVGAGTPSPATR
jgi:hypothetical protein